MLDLMLVGLSEKDTDQFREDSFFENFKVLSFPDLISAFKLVVESTGCLMFIDYDNKDIERVFSFDKTEGIRKINLIAVLTANDSLRNIRAIKRNYINRIFLKPLEMNLIKKALFTFVKSKSKYATEYTKEKK